MLKLLILFFATSAFVFSSFCQTAIYALTSHNDILRVDLSNCDYELVLSGSQLNPWVDFTDIAYEQGELYACSNSHLYKINLISGEVEWINLGNGVDVLAMGLTSDHNGNLYVSGSTLKKYNISTGTIENLGSLGFNTQGDLDFLDGKIYIAACDSLASSKLIEVQISPFTVSVVGPMISHVFGMVRISSLNPNELFISKDYSLLIIDVNTALASVYCSSIFDGITIYGLTSDPDYLSTTTWHEEEEIQFSQKQKEAIFQIPSSMLGQTYYMYNALGEVLSFSPITNENTIIDLNRFPSGIMIFMIKLPNGRIYRQKIISY